MCFIAVCVANLLLAVGVVCLPLLQDEGPHVALGWGHTVRLRHLYAARHGLHVLINGDGSVHGSAEQSPYSLMEISPVDTGRVVIRGVAASHFLCMESSGRLYSSHAYARDDCTFRERTQPDGYTVYVSDRHGTLVSLGGQRRRLQGRDRGVAALSQFLPMVSTLSRDASPRGYGPPEEEPSTSPPTPLTYRDDVDAMESFGKLSQILIHSPSFSKR